MNSETIEKVNDCLTEVEELETKTAPGALVRVLDLE